MTLTHLFVNRLCLTIWKCLTQFLRNESEKETTTLARDNQEPRMLSEGKIFYISRKIK